MVGKEPIIETPEFSRTILTHIFMYEIIVFSLSGPIFPLIGKCCDLWIIVNLFSENCNVLSLIFQTIRLGDEIEFFSHELIIN